MTTERKTGRTYGAVTARAIELFREQLRIARRLRKLHDELHRAVVEIPSAEFTAYCEATDRLAREEPER